MVGCNYKDFEALESLTSAFLRHFHSMKDNSLVLLSTCNRMEVYFSEPEILSKIYSILSSLPPEQLNKISPNLFFLYDKDCFYHLALVTAGLDSLIIGESEIQGQIKHAYEKACMERNIDVNLHFIFQKALSIGKSIRTQFQLGKGLPDLEHIITQLGHQEFTHVNLGDLKVLFIGASEINHKIIKHLKQNKEMKSIAVCSPTLTHAEDFASQYDIEVKIWDNRHDWHSYHWIISGIKTDTPLFSKECFQAPWDDFKVVFDLGVPHNIDPQLGLHLKLKLYDLQMLDHYVHEQRHIALETLKKVNEVVREKVDYHYYNLEKRQLQGKPETLESKDSTYRAA